MFKHKTKKAFSLVEVLVVVFIMSVAFVSFYTVSTVGTKYIIESKNRLAAVALANEKMEIIRNMSYEDIGTVGGFVEGDINPDENVVANGRSYNVKTSVNHVDDSLDEQCKTVCADPVPNDFKTVRVTISWTDSNGQTQEVSSLSRFVPPGLETETDPPGAPWAINVSEKSGGSLVGVSESSVHIVNNDISPAKNTTLETDSGGNILIPSVPASDEGYHITVSKTGYETVETMSTTADFIPTYKHASIALGGLNSYVIVQNKLADLTVRTADYQNKSIGNIGFSIGGGKIIGKNSLNADVFSMNTELGTTDASGEKEYADINPGDYAITMSENTQYQFVDFDPSKSPAELIPGDDMIYTIRVADKNVTSLLLNIVDVNGDSIKDAEAKMTDAGNTEIFSGKKSSAAGIIFYPDSVTQLADGNYNLEIKAAGFNTKTVPITINQNVINVENVQLIAS